MKFGIFFRSTASYLIVLVLLSASNIYAIVKLTQYNTIMLNSNNMDKLLIDGAKMLINLIYIERVNEQKYFLTKDPVPYRQYISAKDGTEICLKKIGYLKLTPERRTALERIKTYHLDYQRLINAEVQDMNKNRSYDRGKYATLKGNVFDAILLEEETLEDYSIEDVYYKSEMVNRVGSSARQVAILSLLLSVLLAALLSFFITRSITKPLANLLRKIRAIQAGAFECDLAISSSPPEINELNAAYNLMCEKLQEMNKMKSNFFSMISHEMKTPLTTMREGASLLLESVGGPITEKQERLLKIINIENNRMTKLVNSILDLAKMKAGMMDYNFTQDLLGPLIDHVVAEFSLTAEMKMISLEKCVAADLPQMRMDVERMIDALINLVGNAVKFTPQGGRVSITARTVHDEVRITVSDTGPGLSPEMLAVVFEEFTSSDQPRGTGLGLAIVKHIAEAHGGKVWVESKVGEGSHFHFTLKIG